MCFGHRARDLDLSALRPLPAACKLGCECDHAVDLRGDATPQTCRRKLVDERPKRVVQVDTIDTERPAQDLRPLDAARGYDAPGGFEGRSAVDSSLRIGRAHV